MALITSSAAALANCTGRATVVVRMPSQTRTQVTALLGENTNLLQRGHVGRQVVLARRPLVLAEDERQGVGRLRRRQRSGIVGGHRFENLREQVADAHAAEVG